MIKFLLLLIAFTACVTGNAAETTQPEPNSLVLQIDRNIAFHEARVASQPDDAEACRMLAGALVSRAEFTGDSADYDRAWEVLVQAEPFDPGSARLLQTRAAVLMSRHRFSKARTLAEAGLHKFPDEPKLSGIAGDAALETGDFSAAENYYRKLLASAPQLSSSWARMAHLQELRGKLDEAVISMEKALEVEYAKPLNADALAWLHAILGEIEAKRGHVDEARRHYDTALIKSPDHLLTLEFLADMEQWQSRPAEAETLYRKLLSLKEDPEYQLSLAALLEQRGENVEAAQLRAAARRFYEWAVTKGNEGYLRPLAIMELAAKNYERAAELAARDLELRPTTESRAIHNNIVRAAAAAGKKLVSSKSKTSETQHSKSEQAE